MHGPTLLEEVRQVNIAFLTLIRDMAQKGDAARLNQVGLTEEMSSRVAGMSDSQMQKLAASSQLLCRFQLQTHNLLSALGSPAESRLAQLRAAALAMATA